MLVVGVYHRYSLITFIFNQITVVKLQHILIAIAVATIFGMGVVITKPALDHFPPMFLLGMRFVFSAAILVWFFRPPWAEMKQIFLASLIGSTLMYGLMFNGLKLIDASLMIIVVQLQVPFASLLAWITFKDRLGWRRTLGVVMAFAGVILIAGSPEEQSALLGISLDIIGAFVWAAGQMLFKRLSGMGGLLLVTWVAVMAGPQLLLCSWIFENGQLEALYTATTVHWLTVFYLVLVLTVIGYSCWYFLLARYDINQVVPFLFVEPVSAVAGGILLLGEELTSNRIFGGLAVLAGVALVTLFSQSTKTNR